jgi:hypothetical protein
LHPVFVIDLVFVFALTMANNDSMRNDQLQDLWTQIDGLTTDIKTLHEWLNSMIALLTERCDQLDLKVHLGP